ncbi:MAG: site-specific integrase [Prevotellaceae bacterium]|jgi:site-specific recombinase XerD|nr:site-specific integrase [Prevotellaceae bacterium]
MKTDKNKGQRSTYSVIFYIKKGNPKKNGLCPLMGRITIDGISKAFSLHVDADPALWDAGENRMTGKSRQSLLVNKEIEKYLQKTDRYYNEILSNQGYITAELVKNTLEGRGQKEIYLLKLFKEHNEEFSLRVGVDKAKGTYVKYCRSYDRLSDFIQYKYDTKDFMLHRLTLSFIEDYDFYLRNDRNMTNNTVSDHMTHLKKIITRAMRQGTLKKNPFFGYVHQPTEMVCHYLQPDELDRIMQTGIPDEALCYVRDIFVFACFTGLAYVDFCKLSEEHLKTDESSKIWICTEREKSKTECYIPLMKLPLQIIEKYRHLQKDGKLFKTLPSGSLPNYFRKLETLCNVKHITFHMARHTFATQITLSQGVSIASISKMLGHTSVSTTQIYAKITGQKVNEDMKVLSGQINGKYVLAEGNRLQESI